MIPVVFLLFLLFELLLQGFGSSKNICRPLPSSSEDTVGLLGLRARQELQQWQLFCVHPMDAVDGA